MSHLSIPVLVDQFLAAKAAAGLSPATIRAYRQRLVKFCDWLQGCPLTRSAIRSYIAELQQQQLAPHTIADYVRDISVFCRWLVEEGELTCNPAAKLIPKLPKLLPPHYTIKQLHRLLAICSVRDYALVLTLLDTGLRVSEFVSLRRDQIDWTCGKFHIVGKGKKERVGWFSPYAQTAIQIYLGTRRDDHVALWYGRRGPLTPNGVYQVVERRAIQAGIRADTRRLVHAMRVTFAKHFITRGGDLESLRRLLGHESLAMSAFYAQLADDELAAKKATVNPLAAVIQASDD